MREETFEQLYAEHAQPLFAFLSYRVGDRAAAEDLLADTFERALKARSRFDRRRGSEKTWLYAIALNCLRDHLRRARSEERALHLVADGASRHASGEMTQVLERDLLARSLDVLGEREREALALRFGADLTVPEIAKLTGERLTTIEGRVYKALRKLRAELGERGGSALVG
jgi:RNA polymerase sigma factor (sigma-70 family)